MVRAGKIRYAMASSFLFVILLFNWSIKAETSFSSISVKGNYRIETSTILSYADIPLNSIVTDAEVNEALQRLVATELFENVEIKVDDKIVNILVKEFPMINEISIEGNDSLDDEKLIDLISSKPLRVYNSTLAANDADKIANAYSSVGRIAAEVNPVIIRRSDNRVDLVFEVFEGKVVEIKRLSFVGNRNFSDSRLRRVLETKQAGLLRQFIKKDVFSEDRIELDKQLLADFYSSRGYIDFKLLSTTSALTRQRDGFFVTFKIDEGFSYSIGNLSIRSEIDGIDDQDYLPILKLERGMVFSPTLVDAAMVRIEEIANDSGLNFVRVNPIIDRQDDTRTLDITFELVRGPRIFVERIDIKGNSNTIDRIIRQQFDTVEGDPFNPRQIRLAAARINALGFFEPIKLETRSGSDEQKIIIDVEVEEVPTGSLTFGASYGQSVGLGGNLKVEQRNLLGRGQRLSLAFDSSSNSRTTSVGFGEPKFLGRDLGFDIDIYNTNTDNQFASYDTNSYALRPSLTFPVSEIGESSLFFSIGGKGLLNLNSDSSKIINDEISTQSASVIGVSYNFDTRRKGLDRDSGVKVDLAQEFAGFGGARRYLKTNGSVGAQMDTLNGNLTLMGELEGGRLQSLTGSSSILDRYFGSGDGIRGFQYHGWGPRDVGAVNNDALGGNLFAALRLEARFPIGFLESYGISGGSFFDTGSVWGLDSTIGSSGTVDDSMILRSSFGLSLFWKTVIGPLRINYAPIVSKQSYDKRQLLDLTISTQF